MKPIRGRVAASVLACTIALALAACGSDSSPDKRGEVLSGPTAVATVTTAQIDGATTAAGTTALTGAASCGVAVHTISYRTVGAANEDTNGTAALMVPTGSSATCSGARPIVLYAHGTSFDKAKNMAAVTQDGEAGLVMAMYAAQGFIVVAPNYTGYSGSGLAYHPYLIADAQAADMIDALRASKAVLASINASASSKLFVTGYSEGGHVAMATHRTLQQGFASQLPVTASGPMSGPYSWTKTNQALAAGTQPVGASSFTPMVLDAMQRAYGNIWTTPSDIYNAPYDTIAPGLLPNANPTTAVAGLPAGITGTYQTLWDAGNGQPFLLKNSFRAQAGDNNSNFMKAVARNDLLNWKPTSPMALCYGAQDPTVFGFNSTDAASWFASQGVTVARYDMEDAATMPGAPGAAVKAGFDALKAQYVAAEGGGAAGTAAAIAKYYHGTMVPPFCVALVRGFFQTVLASAP